MDKVDTHLTLTVHTAVVLLSIYLKKDFSILEVTQLQTENGLPLFSQLRFEQTLYRTKSCDCMSTFLSEELTL